MFNESFQINVARKNVLELVQKNCQTGLVQPEREFPLRIEPTEVAHLGQVQADPTLSTRKLARVTYFRRTRKQHKFYLYKIHLVHQSNDDDFDWQQEFCEIEPTTMDANENYNICLSDDSTFF